MTRRWLAFLSAAILSLSICETTAARITDAKNEMSWLDGFTLVVLEKSGVELSAVELREAAWQLSSGKLTLDELIGRGLQLDERFQGRGLLHLLAGWKGAHRSIEEVVRRGLDPNDPDDHGTPPLHGAITRACER